MFISVVLCCDLEVWTKNLIKLYWEMVCSICTDTSFTSYIFLFYSVRLRQLSVVTSQTKTTIHSLFKVFFKYYMFHQLLLIVLLLSILIVILYTVISLLHLSLFTHHSCILSTHGSWWCGAHHVLEKDVFFTCFGMVWKRVNLTLRGNLWMLFGVRCFCPQEYILKTWTMMYELI